MAPPYELSFEVLNDECSEARDGLETIARRISSDAMVLTNTLDDMSD